MTDINVLTDSIQKCFAEKLQNCSVHCSELTIEVAPSDLLSVCTILRDDEKFHFQQLIDLCGVDYSQYGSTEWQTDSASATGFERGVYPAQSEHKEPWNKPRFAVVYHLLSLSHNHRIRIKVFLEGEPPIVESVIKIWSAADWYEREAFDLFGIMFNGHPDLRRILTDYGFIGHPFRKDFPLIGNVEVRYDAASGRVIYQPVTIPPRVLVPRVIRKDSRYTNPIEKGI